MFFPVIHFSFYLPTRSPLSPDAHGYYCHFDNEIFTCKWLKPDILTEFSFLQFTGNPLVTVDGETRKHLLTILDHLESEYSPEFDRIISIQE
jgi:AraC family transcriptional regulator, transcriptional activator of pobA